MSDYFEEFFRRVDLTKIEDPKPEDLVDGKAFAIRHYPIATRYLNAGDTVQGTVYDDDGIVFETAREEIIEPMTIDTISMTRFNDALGFKNAVGVFFGERKTKTLKTTVK